MNYMSEEAMAYRHFGPKKQQRTSEELEAENAVLKDEIHRHEEVFQFSANKIAALKRKVELAIERIRAEDDPDIGKPWLVEHVLAILTAEEQE